MSSVDRRHFIKQTGLSVASLALGGKSASAQNNQASPLGTPLNVPGVHVYALQESLAAGEEIQFCVSADVPYHFSVVRLGPDPDSPSSDEVLHTFPPLAPQVQPIRPGSCILASPAITSPPEHFSLECWIRPWTFGRWQDVVCQMDYPGNCDFALAISPEGQVTFYWGDGGVFQEKWPLSSGEAQLKLQEWHHVVLTRSPAERSIWLDGKKVAATTVSPSPCQWKAPLRIGAGGTDGLTADYFDGDVALPTLYSVALDASTIQKRFSQKALVLPETKHLLGCWPLNEERGSLVHDISPFMRHGSIQQMATWMIGGPGYDANAPRFDAYEPKDDPTRGHGIRFASDDLFDCQWRITHRYQIPKEARSGIYCGRIRFQQDGAEHLQHATFIVRKHPDKPKASILLLCATNTWRAYSGTPFGKTSPNLSPVFGTGGTENSPGNPPAYDFYRTHFAGQGTYQMGRLLPWPAASPYVLYGGPTRYSHLMRADRFAHIWLEQEAYDFDVISDHDLHRDPCQIHGYKTFIINGHSEYWSAPMFNGLANYLKEGGNTLVLSGNSIFWRVSYNEDGTLLECRKVDAPGAQVPPNRRGECWHSTDGMRGGLANECGIPGWKLIGLTTLGWNNPGNPRNFGPYIAEKTEHFLFHHPETVGLKPGDKFGWIGKDDQTPMANGHEFDVRPSTLQALQEQPSPEGQIVPSDPAGIVRLANGIIPWSQGGAAFDYWFQPIRPKTDQGGEMIYWERPEGGRVFNAGSIGSGWALWADPTLQRLIRNVLHHFGVKKNKASFRD